MSKNEILKNFWEKKNIKKMKKNETIKKISVSSFLKNKYFCY
jgi:hypothetical protein